VGKELDLLRREIDILREVDHPNIIKCYDIYEDTSHIYIIMEYCSGGELFTKITTQGSLNEIEARIYMRKMLMAVSHLHSLNIVHRDLKTENFLFDNKCATKELKLVDFGLSNKFGNRFEQMHSKVGTIYYVAPEVLAGNYDNKCDMWSLGVLMYTMLSGDLPFFDEQIAEVYRKLKSGTYFYSKKL
jgi:Serine/threonine protein kinase